MPIRRRRGRVAPIIDKKRRLGVDSWGTTDEHVRDMLAPIERVFEREFPDYEPYPFGRTDRITLVRTILFAAPMLADFRDNSAAHGRTDNLLRSRKVSELGLPQALAPRGRD